MLGRRVVKGSLVLISGDPGIGKSTILLQICEYLGQNLRILTFPASLRGRSSCARARQLICAFCRNVQLVVEHTARPDIVTDSNDEFYRSEFVAGQRNTGCASAPMR